MGHQRNALAAQNKRRVEIALRHQQIDDAAVLHVDQGVDDSHVVGSLRDGRAAATAGVPRVAAPLGQRQDESVVACRLGPLGVLPERRGVEAEAVERDPDNRVILNPITDENWKLVGLAGLIVDQDYFEGEVLPQSIKHSLPGFEKGADKLTVIVRDARKRQVLPRGSSAGPSSRKTPAELTFWAWQRQNP